MEFKMKCTQCGCEDLEEVDFPYEATLKMTECGIRGEATFYDLEDDVYTSTYICTRCGHFEFFNPELAKIILEDRQKQIQSQPQPQLQPQSQFQPQPQLQPQETFTPPAVSETTAESVSRSSESGLSAEVEFLRSRRQNQMSTEEMKARLKDVVLEKPALKSGAKSLVTHRPRRKEELPAGKYDFPILYPVEEREKDQQEPSRESQKPARESVSVSGLVKKVMNTVKAAPRRFSRVRVKRQRQKQRS